MVTKLFRPPQPTFLFAERLISVDRTLLRIEQKLETVRGILHRAALEAETLTNQGLADDLHHMHADVHLRLLPAVREGKIPGALDSYRT